VRSRRSVQPQTLVCLSAASRCKVKHIRHVADMNVALVVAASLPAVLAVVVPHLRRVVGHTAGLCNTVVTAAARQRRRGGGRGVQHAGGRQVLLLLQRSARAVPR
jgi:hypothetical protein